ncbi:nucleotidyltransferase domain-containing protein [Pelagibaculum spongiae]|uniref:nucleotidyltransferase domain-containing protein n=1 Tax=Pelagibaculum spongiae TaxID=2080658 RepID=UPI0015ABC14E|nr:nucleotidyltransferase domain-containing protein [Pelagibaculum spongiae]
MTECFTRTLQDIDCGLNERVIRQIQQVMAENPEIGKAILYGSRAKGNYRNGSDIDLTLIADNEASLILDSIYQLDEQLDALFLPYSFDLSILSEIDNSNLVQHIQRVGVVFYQKISKNSVEIS